jgi:hypothetical protein
MTTEELWILVRHYERLIAVLLKQIEEAENEHPTNWP